MLTPDIDDSIDDWIEPFPFSSDLLPFNFILTDERIAVRFAVCVDMVWSSDDRVCRLGRELVLPFVFSLSLSCKAVINCSICWFVMFDPSWSVVSAPVSWFAILDGNENNVLLVVGCDSFIQSVNGKALPGRLNCSAYVPV